MQAEEEERIKFIKEATERGRGRGRGRGIPSNSFRGEGLFSSPNPDSATLKFSAIMKGSERGRGSFRVPPPGGLDTDYLKYMEEKERIRTRRGGKRRGKGFDGLDYFTEMGRGSGRARGRGRGERGGGFGMGSYYRGGYRDLGGQRIQLEAEDNWEGEDWGAPAGSKVERKIHPVRKGRGKGRGSNKGLVYIRY